MRREGPSRVTTDGPIEEDCSRGPSHRFGERQAAADVRAFAADSRGPARVFRRAGRLDFGESPRERRPKCTMPAPGPEGFPHIFRPDMPPA